MKIIIVIILLFFSITGFSQYIADPSFEDYNDSCDFPSSINLKSWYDPTKTSSDSFIDTCYKLPNLGLETTKQSYNGYGFIGMILFDSLNPNASEFIETKLIKSLINNQEYCLSLYSVSSSRSNFNVSNIHIGFREDTTFQGVIGKLVVDTFYRFINAPLKDTVNWTKLSIKFTATGHEKFLSIGNFDPPENLDIFSYNSQNVPPYLYRLSYYFFDMITLEECPPKPVEHFLVYPNPSSGGSVYLSNYADTLATVTLYNSLGQRLAERMLPAGANSFVAFEGLASGVYIAVYQTATWYKEEKKLVVLR